MTNSPKSTVMKLILKLQIELSSRLTFDALAPADLSIICIASDDISTKESDFLRVAFICRIIIVRAMKAAEMRSREAAQMSA